MKRIISLILALTLCLSCVFVLASCNVQDMIAKFTGEDTSSDDDNNKQKEEPKHPILEYYEKMESVDNYKLTITMSDVPYFGIVTMMNYVDGNIEYAPETMFNEEEYLETVGEKIYSYTKDEDGKWTKTDVTEYYAEEDELLAEEFFDYNNYEPVEGKENVFKQKNGVDFGEYSNVTFTLGDNSFTIEMTVEEEGMTMGLTLIVSNFGESDLTLPKVK